MLRLFVCISIAVAISYALDAISTAQLYCNTTNCKPNQSVACLYVENSSMKCDGRLLALNKTLIVTLHNRKRNKIALGKVDGYKSAVQMLKINWSNELATMAKYNVMRCKFAHDTCHNTNHFNRSGQNLYTERSTGPDNQTVNGVITDGINSWFNEYKDANMSYINKYNTSTVKIGHFTEMVIANNSLVGCALNKFKSEKKINYYLACNYKLTNIIGKPIYVAGPTGSKCVNGTDSVYKGLCKD